MFRISKSKIIKELGIKTLLINIYICNSPMYNTLLIPNWIKLIYNWTRQQQQQQETLNVCLNPLERVQLSITTYAATCVYRKCLPPPDLPPTTPVPRLTHPVEWNSSLGWAVNKLCRWLVDYSPRVTRLSIIYPLHPRQCHSILFWDFFTLEHLLLYFFFF